MSEKLTVKMFAWFVIAVMLICAASLVAVVGGLLVRLFLAVAGL